MRRFLEGRAAARQIRSFKWKRHYRNVHFPL